MAPGLGRPIKYDFRSNMGIWQTEDGVWHCLHLPDKIFLSLGDAYRAEQKILGNSPAPSTRFDALTPETFEPSITPVRKAQTG